MVVELHLDVSRATREVAGATSGGVGEVSRPGAIVGAGEVKPFTDLFISLSAS